MCGEDSRDIAGLPVTTFQTAIAPDDAQRAALDELAAASATAAATVRAACPADIALTAPRRLAAMQSRIEAMIAAVKTVQPPLERFYGLLSDEQKAKLTALAAHDRPAPTASDVTASTGATASAGGGCGTTAAGLTDWPQAAIADTVKPTEAQRKDLDALRAAAASAADLLKGACQPAGALTPPGRLAAINQRLDVLLRAVTTVRPALETFYGSLTDEQKANFDAIGALRVIASDEAAERPDEEEAPVVRRHRHHRHHGVSVERMIRHMMYFVR
jgi:hypothetical protein